MQTVNGICEICQKPFTKQQRGKPYRFCSRACGVIGRSGPTRKTGAGQNCTVCGKFYELKASHLERRRYCSRECMAVGYDKTGTKNPNWKDAGWLLCEGCGQNFKSYHKERRFCSLPCGYKLSLEEWQMNGRRGFDAEMKCCAELASRGYDVYRSKNSRGACDIYAFGSKGAVLVQVKRTKSVFRRKSRKAVDYIRRVGIAIRDTQQVQVWCWVDDRGWFVTDLKKDGSLEDAWGLDWLGLLPAVTPELDLVVN